MLPPLLPLILILLPRPLLPLPRPPLLPLPLLLLVLAPPPLPVLLLPVVAGCRRRVRAAAVTSRSRHPRAFQGVYHVCSCESRMTRAYWEPAAAQNAGAAGPAALRSKHTYTTLRAHALGSRLGSRGGAASARGAAAQARTSAPPAAGWRPAGGGAATL